MGVCQGSIKIKTILRLIRSILGNCVKILAWTLLIAQKFHDFFSHVYELGFLRYMLVMTEKFSNSLQSKIDTLMARRPGEVWNTGFASPLLLAPMSAICNAPYRLDGRSGRSGTVSELISCHGINYGNARTRHMLKVDPRENMDSTFGEDADAMAAQPWRKSLTRKFIDINMGCPVSSVVTKRQPAPMKELAKLGELFSKVKKAIEIPLTIKIRTGWDMRVLTHLK